MTANSDKEFRDVVNGHFRYVKEYCDRQSASNQPAPPSAPPPIQKSPFDIAKEVVDEQSRRSSLAAPTAAGSKPTL